MGVEGRDGFCSFDLFGYFEFEIFALFIYLSLVAAWRAHLSSEQFPQDPPQAHRNESSSSDAILALFTDLPILCRCRISSARHPFRNLIGCRNRST